MICHCFRVTKVCSDEDAFTLKLPEILRNYLL